MDRPEAPLECTRCDGTSVGKHEGHRLEPESDIKPVSRGPRLVSEEDQRKRRTVSDCHMVQEVLLEREIPSFRMRPYKVVRLIPKRAAAPFGPMITPCVCLSVLQKCSRFKSSRVIACSELPCATGLNLARGEQRVWPRVRITLHSTKFCNSRMF